MNSNRMKSMLSVLTLAGVALVATAAQASGGRHGHDYGHGYDRGPAASHHGHAEGHWGVYKQSRALSAQVNARQQRQMARIQEGIRSGSLNRHEFRELMHEQRRIREMEQHFLADGLLDRREFGRLDHALDIASHNIRDEKHDRQARHFNGRGPWYN